MKLQAWHILIQTRAVLSLIVSGGDGTAVAKTQGALRDERRIVLSPRPRGGGCLSGKSTFQDPPSLGSAPRFDLSRPRRSGILAAGRAFWFRGLLRQDVTISLRCC